MQVVVRTLRLFVTAIVLATVTHAIYAQGIDPTAAIQQKLQERIVLATLDANGEIVTAGSVITLRSGSLQMCATTAPAAAGTPVNSYKNGRLSAGMFSWNLGLGLMKIDPNSIPMHTAVAGEKFWIVHYNVMKNNVQFKIWTDPDSNNLRYWTWLEIPFDKKQVPSPDQFMNTLGEVIAVEPAPGQGGQTGQAENNESRQLPASAGDISQSSGASAQGVYFRTDKTSDTMELGPNGVFTLVQNGRRYDGNYTVQGGILTVWGPKIKGQPKCNLVGNVITDPGKTTWVRPATQNVDATPAASPAPAAVTPPPPPPPQRSYDDVAPPPPPPAPAPTISMGETKDQVTAAFGEPQRKAAAGPKEIFFYTDLKMKVTFTGGKVSSIE
jgi:hypothetical protein